MKKVMYGIVAVVCCVIIFNICSFVEHNYLMNGKVLKMNDNYITFEDVTGNFWEYDFDNKITKDTFKIGDRVIIGFNDNCTDSNRKDDIITKVDFR